MLIHNHSLKGPNSLVYAIKEGQDLIKFGTEGFILEKGYIQPLTKSSAIQAGFIQRCATAIENVTTEVYFVVGYKGILPEKITIPSKFKYGNDELPLCLLTETYTEEELGSQESEWKAIPGISLFCGKEIKELIIEDGVYIVPGALCGCKVDKIQFGITSIVSDSETKDSIITTTEVNNQYEALAFAFPFKTIEGEKTGYYYSKIQYINQLGLEGTAIDDPTPVLTYNVKATLKGGGEIKTYKVLINYERNEDVFIPSKFTLGLAFIEITSPYASENDFQAAVFAFVKSQDNELTDDYVLTNGTRSITGFAIKDASKDAEENVFIWSCELLPTKIKITKEEDGETTVNDWTDGKVIFSSYKYPKTDFYKIDEFQDDEYPFGYSNRTMIFQED